MSNTITQETAHNKSLAWFLLILLSIVWGSSFILIKKGLTVYNPGEVASIRIIAATLSLVPFSIMALRGVRGNQWFILFVVGITGTFAPAILFSTAQTKMDSGITGVLNALTPFFALIIGVLFYRQKLKSNAIWGLIIGFVGCALLVLTGNQGIGDVNFYALFIVLATICYGVNLNLIKYNLVGLKPIQITGISLLLVCPLPILYLIFFTNFNSKLSTEVFAFEALGLVALLGVMGTAIALVLFNKLLQMSSTVFASSVTYLIPINALIIGAVDGEQILLYHIIGMTIIIIGVYTMNTSTSKKKKPV